MARSFGDVGRRELIGRSAGLASLGLPNLKAGPQQKGPALNKPQTLLLGGGEASVSFPEWLAGCWGYEPVLVGVQFPLGKQFVNRETPGVTKASIVEAADIGASTRESPIQQRARWVQGSSGSGADEDLAVRLSSSLDGLLGEGTVESVKVDSKNPRRVSVLFSTRRRDGEGRDARKAELFQNYGRGTLLGEDSFRSERLWRQVSQAKNNGYVYDYCVVEEFERVGGEEEVSYTKYISAFLQSADPKYFDVGEKAVAVYKFEGLLSKADCEL